MRVPHWGYGRTRARRSVAPSSAASATRRPWASATALEPRAWPWSAAAAALSSTRIEAAKVRSRARIGATTTRRRVLSAMAESRFVEPTGMRIFSEITLMHR